MLVLKKKAVVGNTLMLMTNPDDPMKSEMICPQYFGTADCL